MKKAAIIYDSHDGHTQQISEKLFEIIDANEVETKLFHINEFDSTTINDYNLIAIGSPIRYGKHLPDILNFIKKNKSQLSEVTTAFYSVNLTARKPHRSTPETSNYIKKMIARLDWQPDVSEVFAGKLNYPIYRFSDKAIIRFIMWITEGPTNTATVHDYTDWQQVEKFAHKIINNLN
ncbi:MAG: menaquinone-dependent protoporphyrinogen IX dehydrogenase [Gammaproteobacteria bacterium]|nr:menaquinone-dependent protoporphyrinogen IX dehydrogenase [Gammaproteobacteria bacterium]